MQSVDIPVSQLCPLLSCGLDIEGEAGLQMSTVHCELLQNGRVSLSLLTADGCGTIRVRTK